MNKLLAKILIDKVKIDMEVPVEVKNAGLSLFGRYKDKLVIHISKDEVVLRQCFISCLQEGTDNKFHSFVL